MLFEIFNSLVSKVKSYVSRVKSWPSSLRLNPELCQKSVLGQVSHLECGLRQCTESRFYSVSLLVRASGLGNPDGCWPLVTPPPPAPLTPPVLCECMVRIWLSKRTPALQTLSQCLLQTPTPPHHLPFCSPNIPPISSVKIMLMQRSANQHTVFGGQQLPRRCF